MGTAALRLMIRRILMMKNWFMWGALALLSSASCSDSGGDTDPKGDRLAAPSEVAAEFRGASRVEVSWKDLCTQESGYSIWLKGQEDETPQRVGFTAADAESYTVNMNLEPGKSYCFGVRTDGRKASMASEIVYAAPLAAEDPAKPGVVLEGEAEATSSCIALRYRLRNAAELKDAVCGVCWNTTGSPTVKDARQDGPEPVGDKTILQAIPNVLLEYGRKFHFRAYLRSGNTVCYSAEAVAALGEEPQAITLNWKKIDTEALPRSVSVYETTDRLNGRNFHAWYAVADLAGDVELRVNMPDAKATIDDQMRALGGACHVLVNAGYFYGANHVGVAVVNGTPTGYIPDMRGSLRAGDPEYGVMYHATRGIFGVDDTGKAAVCWVGTSGSNYYFDRPLPSVKGEAKYAPVSSSNPATNVVWNPRHAVSAGPVLLREGKCPFDFTLTEKGKEYYLSNFEIIPYDIFGPDVSPDRTAVGHTADGKVILFICDGRIPESRGATLTELAMILKGLGCVGALNLDGGGSTGMMVGDRHVNDCSTENRPVKTTIGFFRKTERNR